jgi:hypothetical protein
MTEKQYNFRCDVALAKEFNAAARAHFTCFSGLLRLVMRRYLDDCKLAESADGSLPPVDRTVFTGCPAPDPLLKDLE